MIQPPVGSAPPRPPVLTARSSSTNACMHGASRPAQLQLPESPRVKRATTLRKDCVGTPASRGTSSSIMTPHPTSSWRTAPCWQDGEQAREQHFRSAGASVIQRAYRRMKFVYATFGPMVFCRKEGGPADFGKLAFADRSSLDVANFITISDTTSIEHFTNFTSFYWKLIRPEVIISVTGGARNFELSPRLQRMFDRGLVDAARASKAWVITGGTDTGVMKLAANALRSHGVDHPIIGIVPYGCVNNKEVLEGLKGGTAYYPASSPTSKGAPLNARHTYFILVDNGISSPPPWGSEIAFRAQFESEYRERKRVPSVLLVVQGGPGTLGTILTTARVETPIVILVESGGAARAVYSYVQNGAVPDGFETWEDSLREIASCTQTPTASCSPSSSPPRRTRTCPRRCSTRWFPCSSLPRRTRHRQGTRSCPRNRQWGNR